MIWLGIEAAILTARLLPRICFLHCADFLANVAFYLCRDFRVRSMRNIAAASDGAMVTTAAERIARGSLRNFFRSFVELAYALAAPADELRGLVSISGKQHLDSALQAGSGVLLLSGHFGNFFLLGTRLALEDYVVSALVNPPKDEKLAQLMDDYRWRIGQKTIHARPREQALLDLGASLRRNEIVVMIADEYRRGKGVPVSLFGRTVIAKRGPATVALRTGAVIVPARMLRQPGGGLQLTIEPALELDRSAKGREQIETNMRRITQWLERAVREHPEQWNWMNIRWSTHKRGSEKQEAVRQGI
jgi:KDO2-lipid IV(A) lauroyltransferase